MNLDNVIPVHANDRYVVVVMEFPEGCVSKNHGATFTHGYAVINIQTEVAEVFTPQLPDAIAAAEQLDVAMETQVWKWIRIEQETRELAAAADKEVH